MDYTTLLSEIKERQNQPQKGMQSLYEVCQQVGDGRGARGKRYDLAGLLVVLIVAKLAGMKSLVGASEWVRDQGKRLREQLGLSWKQMPCANTSKYALARLESQQVNAQLAAWFVRCQTPSQEGQERPDTLHLAMEGKVLKGTGKQAYGGEEPQKHVLHVYEGQTGLVLQQCPIAVEHNEVSTLKPLLTEVLCKGRIITADAAASAIMRLGAWFSGREVTWSCSSKGIPRLPERTWSSFLKTARLIGALGSLTPRSRKAMAVSNGVRSSRVLTSMTICPTTGARSVRSFACNANAPAKTRAAWRSSTAGQAFRPRSAPRSCSCG
jgi:DDE_Tnp_1-associated